MPESRKRRCRKLAFVSACLWLACTLPAVRADYSATVNGGTSWGQWQGWGTSLAWWANVFGNRSDLADLVFSPRTVTLNGQALPGLDLNIARYNLGASSFAPASGQSMVVSPNIPAYRQIQGYWLNPTSSDPSSASWNWNADANQRQMLEMAHARGADCLELFSNSPMWWMCSNHNPSGASSGSADNLNPSYYQADAVYLATVARYAADHWGINFTSVDAFNEPIANWWTAAGTQEGCHFNVPTQASVIGYLRTELNSRGLTGTPISASDESYYDMATSTWNSLPASTRAMIGQVNVHGYQYGGGRRDLLYQAVRGTTLWNSEYGDSEASGMPLASNLNLDFHWLHPTAWSIWQPLDSGGWGLVQSELATNSIGTANPKYFVVAQYSRHIRPGMTILDTSDANSVSAYDPVNHKIVIVTANYATAQWATFSFADFYSVPDGPVSHWRTVTNTGEDYHFLNDLSVSNGTVRLWCPADSVQTVEIPNAYLTAVPEPGALGLLACAMLLIGLRRRGT